MAHSFSIIFNVLDAAFSRVLSSVLMPDTCIFHVFVQQVLQVLLLVVVELSLQSQEDVLVQQHPDQMEGTWAQKRKKVINKDPYLARLSPQTTQTSTPWFQLSSHLRIPLSCSLFDLCRVKPPVFELCCDFSQRPTKWLVFIHVPRSLCASVWTESTRPSDKTLFNQGESGHYNLWRYCSNLLQAGLY